MEVSRSAKDRYWRAPGAGTPGAGTGPGALVPLVLAWNGLGLGFGGVELAGGGFATGWTKSMENSLGLDGLDGFGGGTLVVAGSAGRAGLGGGWSRLRGNAGPGDSAEDSTWDSAEDGEAWYRLRGNSGPSSESTAVLGRAGPAGRAGRAGFGGASGE